MPYTTFMHSGARMHRKAYNVLRNHFRRSPQPSHRINQTMRTNVVIDTKKRKKYSKVDDDSERVRIKQKTQSFENDAQQRALIESDDRKRRQDAEDEKDWVFLKQQQIGKNTDGSNVGSTEPLTDFIGGARL